MNSVFGTYIAATDTVTRSEPKVSSISVDISGVIATQESRYNGGMTNES